MIDDDCEDLGMDLNEVPMRDYGGIVCNADALGVLGGEYTSNEGYRNVQCRYREPVIDVWPRAKKIATKRSDGCSDY